MTFSHLSEVLKKEFIVIRGKSRRLRKPVWRQACVISRSKINDGFLKKAPSRHRLGPNLTGLGNVFEVTRGHHLHPARGSYRQISLDLPTFTFYSQHLVII
ncbi:hypothetical protein TH5_23055 [Thalassospira xianhensis MCCC 1A02616]|uniref:Uncharacterized protein n=1 Tax=Thalassospira xianhensis MCCC 1A02616 TaxID=1177929 RepID=A0A367U6C6_9PROT|nr:hypothetical protein TH5_23055 [Thalassospira xianhensis MCCC 1A02616]